MAEARRCDRCGTLYSHSFKLYKLFVAFNYPSDEPFDFNTKLFDLCTDCTADLIAWFIGRNHGRAKLQEYGIVDKF